MRSTITISLAENREPLDVHSDGVSHLQEVDHGLRSHFLVNGSLILPCGDEGKDAFITNLLAEITVNATGDILK